MWHARSSTPFDDQLRPVNNVLMEGGSRPLDAVPHRTMMRAQWKTAVFVLLAALCAAGCNERSYELQATAWPFRIYSNEDLEICPGQLEAFQDHYEVVGGRLGVSIPEGSFIDVVVLPPEEATEACRSDLGTSACADGTRVYTDRLWHPHEVIHAYTTYIGDPPAVLREGLAVVLACGFVTEVSEPITRNFDILDLMFAPEVNPIGGSEQADAYWVYSDFVRFLIDELGWETFLRLYAELDRGSGQASIESAFEETTGSTVADTVARWEATPVRSLQETCLFLFQCGQPELPDGVEVPFECGTPVQNDLPGLLASIAPGNARRLSLDVEGRGPVFATAQGCGSGPAAGEAVLLQAPGYDRKRLLWDLPDDQMWLGAHTTDPAQRPLDGGVADRLTATKRAQERGPDLGCASPLVQDVTDLDLLEVHAMASSPTAPEGTVLKLRSSVRRQLTLQNHDLDAESIWWCTDACTTGPPCIQAATAGEVTQPTLTLEPGSTHSLIVQPPALDRGMLFSAVLTDL